MCKVFLGRDKNDLEKEEKQILSLQVLKLEYIID